MTASEQAVQVSRKELAEMVRGSVTIEHYEVPVFVRRSRPASGAGVRLARVECAPGHIDAFIEEFRNTAAPELMDMQGMASAHLLTDRTSGRCVVVTGWQDMAALAASRAATARLRADAAAAMHLQVRAVEEYALVFTSVRDSDTRSLIERDIELWNARDQEGWMAGTDLLRATTQMPGGIQLTGREAAETMWNTWQEAFPDNRIETIAIHADDRGGVHEFRATGTHSGTLRGAGRRDTRDRQDRGDGHVRRLRVRGGQDHQLPPLLRPGGAARPAGAGRRQLTARHREARPARGARLALCRAADVRRPGPVRIQGYP